MIYAVFGTIDSPYTGTYKTGPQDPSGLIVFVINLLRTIFMVAGILLLFNLVLAGLQFLNAGGDPKAIEQAWNKIWQSIVGLLIVVSAFLVTAIISYIFFGDPMFILHPVIYGP